MTEISLNDQFEELVLMKLQEQQQEQDNDVSAKNEYFFQDNDAFIKIKM